MRAQTERRRGQIRILVAPSPPPSDESKHDGDHTEATQDERQKIEEISHAGFRSAELTWHICLGSSDACGCRTPTVQLQATLLKARDSALFQLHLKHTNCDGYPNGRA